jgi:hypothetical protein
MPLLPYWRPLPGIALVAMAAQGSPWRGGPCAASLRRRAVAAFSMSVATTIAVCVGVGRRSTPSSCLYTTAPSPMPRPAPGDGIIFEDAAGSSASTAFAANLVVAAVLAPVSEELAKSLSVRFTMAPNATRAQCFLLGAAAGAAFGFLEALLYGLAGIQEGGLGSWWEIMLVRGGSTSLHVICTGLAGLAGGTGPALDVTGSRSPSSPARSIHAGWNAVFGDRCAHHLNTINSRTLGSWLRHRRRRLGIDDRGGAGHRARLRAAAGRHALAAMAPG